MTLPDPINYNHEISFTGIRQLSLYG